MESRHAALVKDNSMTVQELARYFDHTVLKPDAAADDILRLCDEARQWNFATVCVAPIWVAVAADMLKGSGVGVATVAGFPHGNTLPKIKALETGLALEAGAAEVDMVMAVGHAREGAWHKVEADIRGVVEAARARPGAIVKVIFENALLTEDEIQKACLICNAAGAHYVKTSTGFAASGATVEDVRLMRRTAQKNVGVKAAGGIRDLETALAMIEAGATRLGSSASVKILEEFQEREGTA
jgi:deoxyribose-phosphate aldolase